jgi:arginyl-tRNA synthetase
MSGRRGRFIAFDDVLSEGVERAFREVTERSPLLDEEERRRIAEIVGIGSVRYAMIAVASNKPITFTWDRVLNFEQNSAPFIQYAHARACNILAKVGSELAKCGPPDYTSVQSNYEKDLMVMLSIFPEVVSDAAKTLRPEMLAEFANNLASKFNLFYDNIPVLKAEGGTKAARLKLVEFTKLVIANALFLIGIEAPSRM